MQYAEIAGQGYFVDPHNPSNVAFFPAFPLSSRLLSWLTGSPIAASLVAIAHGSLLSAFVLMHRYARERFASANVSYRIWVLLAMGLWPTTFFFRMAYSESLFLLLMTAAMYLMQRGSRPLCVAIVVGLATATRPVGVALLGPFALYLWERTGTPGDAHEKGSVCRTRSAQASRFWRFLRSAVWLPLACWGIFGYILFQYVAFDEPLAFFHTQQHWAKRAPTPYLEQWGRALILEPIWSVYDSGSVAYWARSRIDPKNPLFSLPFANPIYFVASVFFVLLGWHKRWLNGKEVLLAALLLGIPYFTHSYRHLMLSQGRFAAVAFPVYIVMGRLMARARRR